jgi:hypothetical protein
MKGKLTFLIIFALLFAGCNFEYSITRIPWDDELQKAREVAQEIMDIIIAEDEEALFNMLVPLPMYKDRQRTREQIREAFAFIDGNIISYELPMSTGSGGKSWREGRVTEEDFSPWIKHVITDAGKEYRISFYYIFISESAPDSVGLQSIAIRTIVGNHGFSDRVGINYDYERTRTNVIPASNAPNYRLYLGEVVASIRDENAEELKNKFCPLIADMEGFDEQIRELFNFIDGNLIRGSSNAVFSEMVEYDEGTRIRYSYFGKIRRIESDTGEAYNLQLYFELMNDGYDEKIGASELRIIRLSDREEYVVGDYLLVFPEHENRRFPY